MFALYGFTTSYLVERRNLLEHWKLSPVHSFNGPLLSLRSSDSFVYELSMKASYMNSTMTDILVFSGSAARQARTFELFVFISACCWVLARICKSYEEYGVEPWTNKTAW